MRFHKDLIYIVNFAPPLSLEKQINKYFDTQKPVCANME